MRALLVFSIVLLAGLSRASYDDATVEPVHLTKDQCQNGGVFHEEDDTKCECQSYWTEPKCDQIICVNGGYPIPIVPVAGEKQVCYCPKGYYGIHCDAVKLARPVEGVFNTKKTKSFNLYIHNELTDWYGKAAVRKIQTDVPNIIKNYNSTFKNFNLFVSENTTEVELKNAPVGGVNSQDDFVAALAAVIPKTTTQYSCGQSNIVYKDLLNVLKTNQIEDSVLLMFTQYAPKDVDGYLDELKRYLRAFRIKLNVLIGSDDILLDCNSKKNKDFDYFKELKSLAYFTDGEVASYLIEDVPTVDELLPSFIRASASPQSHARISSNTCEKSELNFKTDPYPNTYYIAVRSSKDKPASIMGTCSSGGELSDPIPSYYSEFSIFTLRSGAQQDCKLIVKTDTECIATVYSVGGEPDVDSFEIFHSFTTTADMDTDSISSYQDEDAFLTMHIEVPAKPKYKIKSFNGLVTVKNEQDVIYEEKLIARSSTFEYQSDVEFPCPINGTSWIQLELQGYTTNERAQEDLVAVLNRMIPLNCEERKATSVVPTPKMLRLFDVGAPTKETSTLVLMYSNKLPTPEFSRFILESVDEDVVRDKFYQFGYLRFEAAESRDLSIYAEKDFAAFKKAVYDNAPDNSLTYQDNLKQNLEKLTAGPSSITSDSLVAIAIQHSMVDPIVNNNQYAANLNKISNLGAKLLFVGNVDTVKMPEETSSLEVYTRMAAISAGHVVLMDMYDFTDKVDENGEQPFYVSLALRDLYLYGPSQRLLAYSNLEWNQTTDATSQSKPIGTLQVSKDTTEVFVSLTLNVLDPSTVAQAFMLSIVLEGAKDRIVLNLDQFTLYGSPKYARSNLYTAKFTVVGGESYDGTFTVLATTPYTGAHIRFWTARKDSDVIPKLTYANFDMQTQQPDNDIGAALQAPGSEGEKMRLRIFDENGLEPKRFDQDQNVAVVDGIAHFVPYFCDSAQSTSLSNGMYTIELTYASGFKYFRPMYCSNSTATPVCKEEDSKGNTYCTESNPPFHRGPSKKLIDCSGEGQVVYSKKTDAENHYECICKDTFTGKSCEQSSCSAGIEHLPEETDTSFRTLSYVLMSPAGPDGCTSLKTFYAKDAKALFDGTKTYANIWQYTFSIYFTDGTVKTLYRGPSYSEFFGTFTKLSTISDDDIDTYCGDDTQKKPMDMNEVFNVAVESVGRNSRGIVFLYAIQTFGDDPDNNELEDAFAGDDLYQTIQAYQQHIYIVTPTITEDILSLTTASGGFAVRMFNDYSLEYKTSMSAYQNILNDLITSQIGWAAVSNVNKTSSWVVRKNANLFVTSRTLEKDKIPPKVTTTESSAAIHSFANNEEDEDDDKTITQYTVITVAENSPVTINVEFDATKEYELIQVVILTKEDPIQNALIGQGQGNTDKHAAGATVNSTKAVHISFNKAATDFYFDPTDKNWRQASRVNCSFAQEFVDVTSPFETAGAFSVDFTVSPIDVTDPNFKPDETKSFSLSIPLAVSEAIDCVHGEFQEDGSYCDCGEENDWSGPTCSQPTCQNKGKLNSHGDHCDCSESLFGGVFCKDPNPSTPSTEESTTVDPED